MTRHRFLFRAAWSGTPLLDFPTGLREKAATSLRTPEAHGLDPGPIND